MMFIFIYSHIDKIRDEAIGTAVDTVSDIAVDWLMLVHSDILVYSGDSTFGSFPAQLRSGLYVYSNGNLFAFI